MTNHAHIVVHVRNDSLSTVMKNINFRYARWFNKKYKRIGHLFQGRYRSIAVDDEEYLLNLCHYIHCNPVEAKMVLHPDYYFWSSHHYYLSQDAPEWMAIDVISSAIKNKTGDSYSEFINKPIDREKWKPGLFLSESGDVVIDTDVVRNLHLILNVDESEYKRKKKSLSRDFVADIVCKNININYAQLLAGSHNRKICCMRALLVHFWLIYTNMNITDIAKHLRRTRGTLQRQLDRLIKQNNNYFSLELIHKIQSELDFFLL